jgi:hypothetical protein
MLIYILILIQSNQLTCQYVTVWWLTNPSEEYDRQLGLWHSQLNGKIKHVPNHQPGYNTMYHIVVDNVDDIYIWYMYIIVSYSWYNMIPYDTHGNDRYFKYLLFPLSFYTQYVYIPVTPSPCQLDSSDLIVERIHTWNCWVFS